MKKLLIVFAFMIFVLSNSKAFAASPPPVSADRALLIDTTSGKVIYAKNENERFYPASITKIMTALIVLQNCKLDDKVIIGKNPSSFIDGDKIYIFEGEVLTVNELLHALLIASANDVAVALAEHVAGTEAAFADMMNEKAKELGCTGTHFVNSHGLDDPNHYTTAHDMMLIAEEAMKYDAFRQIVNTKSYTMAPTNKQPLPRPLNTNVLILFNNKYHVDGANGVKVGYTDIAGHSVVGSAYRGDTKLIVVLLNEKTKTGMWEDTSSLLNYGFDNYKTVQELKKDDKVYDFKVPGTNFSIPLTAADDFYYTYPSDETLNISTKVVITSNYFFDILKGQRIGYVEYLDNGSEIGKVDLMAAAQLPAVMLYHHKESKNSILASLLKPSTFTFASGIFAISMLIMSISSKKRKRSSR